MATTKKDSLGRTIVQDTKAIPTFTTEAEEQAYWETHSLATELFEAAPRQDYPDLSQLERSKKRVTSTHIRFDEDTTKRLKQLAKIKGTKYQTLLKQFVTERLYEEEKREGILGRPRVRKPG